MTNANRKHKQRRGPIIKRQDNSYQVTFWEIIIEDINWGDAFRNEKRALAVGNAVKADYSSVLINQMDLVPSFMGRGEKSCQ